MSDPHPPGGDPEYDPTRIMPGAQVPPPASPDPNRAYPAQPGYPPQAEPLDTLPPPGPKPGVPVWGVVLIVLVAILAAVIVFLLISDDEDDPTPTTSTTEPATAPTERPPLTTARPSTTRPPDTSAAPTTQSESPTESETPTTETPP